MASDDVIIVEKLTREYVTESGYLFKKRDKVLAVDEISFSVQRGELFGFVGPNGAGKTTTVKILCTLLLPTSGTAIVLGHHVTKDARKIRYRINVVFGGERGLYWNLSGRDNLTYFANLYGLDSSLTRDRVEELLGTVGLTDYADQKVEGYSRGMKQRLHLAKGLINDPEVIFMDEPTQGLDPEVAHRFRQILKTLSKEGKTIFLTTHYMLEADELCDRVAIINNGKIVASDTPEALKRFVKDEKIIEIEVVGVSEDTVDEIRRINSVNLVTVETLEQKQLIKIQSPEAGQILPLIVQKLSSLKILDVRMREPALEDAYLRLTETKSR